MGLEYDLFISRLFSKADKSSIPLSGSFELTSRCPLDCKMCYIHRKANDCEAIKSEKPAQWWIDLAKQAKSAGMFMLLLTGGEPLLRQDFDEIYLGVRNEGLMVSVNTNALLLDESKLNLFTRFKPQKLNITIYGASSETYENLCGNGEAYDKVVSAVRSLVEAGVGVKLNFTVTPYNVQDTQQIYAFAKSLNLPIQSVSYMFPPVRVGEGEAFRLSPSEAARSHLECRLINMGSESLKNRLLSKSTPTRRDPVLDSTGGERIPCRAGLSSFWVNWDGKMSLCGMLADPVFEIESFSQAWESVKKAREGIFLPSKCNGCDLREYCDVCAAVAKAETGEFNSVPDFACKKAAEYKRLCDEFLRS